MSENPETTETTTETPDEGHQPDEATQEGQEPHGTEPDWKPLARKWEGRAKENLAAKEALTKERDALQAERDELAAKVTSFESQQERQKTVAEVAEAAGVPAEALRGETREDLEAHAQVMKELLNNHRPGPVVGSQGKTGRLNVADPKRDAARKLFGGKD